MTTTTHSPPRHATATVARWCGIVAGPLFVAAFLVQGIFKPDYNPLRHPVSALALGPLGAIQTANFLLTGVLVLAFATIALSRTHKPTAVLIGLWGLGLIAAGIFQTDPVSGFPKGTPAIGEPTLEGSLHDGFSVAGFLCVIAAIFVTGRRQWKRGHRTQAATSIAIGIATAAFFGLFAAAFSQTQGLVEYGGAFQRACVILGFGWITALAIQGRTPTQH